MIKKLVILSIIMGLLVSLFGCSKEAGNGTGNGSWIKDKVAYVVVEKVDEGYIIKEMGTGK